MWDMSNFLNGVCIRAKWAKSALVQKTKNFIREERGGAEIIAVIILVAIVVLLAVAFRSQLGELVKNIWSAIKGQEKTITGEFDLG
jgi:flagellin-like protein